ncbi:transmembrane transcriptional regulator (anti-sigma factor) [Caballeronia udeis]|uniref:Transmembrane transcriptional regulator (Anti-sigma factor) n=1 Tax=Caballeronia udeis TaxID=1232866 RepID=A0A158JSE6_9BURK|nr:anti-sigma factor [Caballeronia udeis]SAL71250.1 transmembrane transcriptional regulator (anti-sigma factor) [Caballeronia udeis]
MNNDADPTTPDPGEQDIRALSAFADNELSAGQRAATLEWLANDPKAAARVAHYRAQRTALTVMLAASGEGARRIVLISSTRWWPRAGMAAACMGMGVALGYAAGGFSSSVWIDQPVFVDRADAAYAVYTPEQRHAVEVTAADEDHLATWLSTRLGQPLAAPSLRAYGYSLLGGRLLPGESGPAALFMYQNAIGARLTLYVATVRQDLMASRLYRKGKRNSIYWTSQGRGYALTGQVTDAQLRSMKIDVDSALGVVVR